MAYSYNRENNSRYYTYTTSGIQSPIIIGNDIPCSLFLKPSATASIEWSGNAIDEIQNGTAEWFTWPKGIVASGTYSALVSPLGGIRVNIVTGTANLSLWSTNHE